MDMETSESTGTMQQQPRESRTRARGFASMDREKQREIARKGGRAAHEKGTAHQFTSDEARAAGRKGGERVSANREHMSRIGRMGGKSSAGRRSQQAAAGTDNTDNTDKTMPESGPVEGGHFSQPGTDQAMHEKRVEFPM